MISKIEIEKYKMLISAMPEDKAIEATEMLKDAMKDGAETSKTLPKINKFVMQNANVYIVKDEKEIEGKDLTKYDLVMFDCDVRYVTDFSNCPKKMIFNKNVNWHGIDFEQLPDISGAIVCGDFKCYECKNLTSLEGAPKEVGGGFSCCSCHNLTSLEGAPKEVGGGFNCRYCENLTSLKGAPEKVGGGFNCSSCYELKSLEGAPKEVGGDFKCYGCNNLKSLEGAPKEVGGDFGCWECSKLTSLEGAPEKVGGDFSCRECKNLESLNGAPKEVGRDFDCWKCSKLTSLRGAPEKVGGDFGCWECSKLTSLEGAPKEVGRDFSCSDCDNLKSLEGAPKEVGGDFSCRECINLTSLEGAPKEVGGDFNCSRCFELKSLEGAPKEVGGSFYCDSTNITSLEGVPEKVVGFLYCNDSSRYLIQDGQYYDLFNLPKDKEFVINGNLDLSRYEFEQLPDLSNVIVKGDFDCYGCDNLTSLEGAPKEVGGDFNCSYCENITSLEGAPEKVGGDFKCYECKNLTSLEGAPKEVGGDFDCSECENLESLGDIQDNVLGCIICGNNVLFGVKYRHDELPSEYLPIPKEVDKIEGSVSIEDTENKIVVSDIYDKNGYIEMTYIYDVSNKKPILIDCSPRIEYDNGRYIKFYEHDDERDFGGFRKIEWKSAMFKINDDHKPEFVALDATEILEKGWFEQYSGAGYSINICKENSNTEGGYKRVLRVGADMSGYRMVSEEGNLIDVLNRTDWYHKIEYKYDIDKNTLEREVIEIDEEPIMESEFDEESDEYFDYYPDYDRREKEREEYELAKQNKYKNNNNTQKPILPKNFGNDGR